MQLYIGKEVVLVIPDLQCPFEHKDAMEFLKVLKKAIKPTQIVCIGDSLDAHALSMYVHDPDGMSASDEYSKALVSLKKLYKIFPNATEVVSNHNQRIAKRAYNAGIPSSFLKSYREIMKYPEGWELKECLEIDKVLYEHGHSQGGVHAAFNLMTHHGQSTVIGHHHAHAGVTFKATRNKMIFGMNVGCLIDNEAYAFAYARDGKFKPTLGAGVVMQGIPYFVPMPVDKDGRWTGELFLMNRKGR